MTCPPCHRDPPSPRIVRVRGTCGTPRAVYYAPPHRTRRTRRQRDTRCLDRPPKLLSSRLPAASTWSVDDSAAALELGAHVATAASAAGGRTNRRQRRDFIRVQRPRELRSDEHHQLRLLTPLGPALEDRPDDRDLTE